MSRPFLALLGLAALVGCTGAPGPEADVWTAGTMPATRVLTGTAVLGWVAAAGEHTFAGDQVVGVRSHDQCPARSFAVPEDAMRLTVEVSPGKGVGAYTIAFSSPEQVTYERRPVPAPFQVEVESPVSGVWRVEGLPSGAVVNQAWDLSVELEVGEEEGGDRGELQLVPDPDCLL